MDLIEGTGESSSPPPFFAGGFSSYDVRDEVYDRLVEGQYEEVVSNPDYRELLDAHFNRLPLSYGLDVNMDRVEDVLLHQKILAFATDPKNRPVYNIRFLENTCSRTDGDDDLQFVSSFCASRSSCDAANGVVPSEKRSEDCANEFEPCPKLEHLNLDAGRKSGCTDDFPGSEAITTTWVVVVVQREALCPGKHGYFKLEAVSYTDMFGLFN